MYDTYRLKFRRNLPENNPFFKDKIHSKELDLESNSSRFVYTNNEWRKEQRQKKIYTPKYWIEQDFKCPEITYFVIEFSWPKLIGKSSTEGWTSDDFNKGVILLLELIRKLGIFMFNSELLNAIPIVLSVCKNIDITKLCSCNLALEALSPFNDRFRSEQRRICFWDTNYGGKEVHFINRNTSFKVYSKIPEVANNAITPDELKIAENYKQKPYQNPARHIPEILRFEYTMRNKQAIIQKFRGYMKEPPTVANIFKPEIAFNILKEEVEKIYNHPLKNFIFLSQCNRPMVQEYLDKNCKSEQVKDNLCIALLKIQEGGIKKAKQYFFNTYKSKKTWYNYLSHLQKLGDGVDFSKLHNLTATTIHGHILDEFGINRHRQDKLL